MSETSAQIFAESAALSLVVNPGHSPTSNRPIDTTRSPSLIEQDIETQEGIIARYGAAVLAETGKRTPVDAGPYWELRYKLAHYVRERRLAIEKGNA